MRKINVLEFVSLDGVIEAPGAFKVTESAVTSKGLILVNYQRAGAVPTGSL